MKMKVYKKWIITPENKKNYDKISKDEWLSIYNKEKKRAEIEYLNWENNYSTKKYTNVWSMTKDKYLLKFILKEVELNSGIEKILIPGCGSMTNLQKFLHNKLPNIKKILCTDISHNAIKQAQSNTQRRYSNKIIYKKYDSCDFYDVPNEYFDMVIIVNSILSENDIINRKILSECYRILKKSGNLIGFFPSVFCIYEISFLEDKFSHYKDDYINIYKNKFYEKNQKSSQIFYTPLRLNRIFKEAGFKREKFELYFCDSDYFIKENDRIYELGKSSDVCIWEFFVRLIK
jgi:ubiquinone/menaquinone biosynthesis C-methylase UbiE